MTEPFFPFALRNPRTIQDHLVDSVPTPNTDQDAEPELPELPFIVETDNDSLVIGFEGYSDFGSSYGYGRPIHIEFYEGKLMLRVWADINSEEPTHVINLSGALESKRGNGDVVHCPHCQAVAMCDGPVSMTKDYYCPDCCHHFDKEEAT